MFKTRNAPRRVAVVLLAAALSGGLSGCLGSLSAANNVEPTAGYVTDLKRFEEFIALQPTPEQFRAAYPDVQLVLPGEIATKELRFNNSRYFAKLDEKGRHIIGGRFQ